jgi:hypothetical protein
VDGHGRKDPPIITGNSGAGMTEYGPYGPIETDLDRELTEAWLQEDRQAQEDRDADNRRFAALSEAEQEAELDDADWGR